MEKIFKVIHWEKFNPDENPKFPQHQIVKKEYTELNQREAESLKEELERKLSDSYKKMKAPEGHEAFYFPEAISNREYHEWVQICEE